jgi:hypothetical protein
MSRFSKTEQNPHLTSPWEGEGSPGALGTMGQESQRCSSLSEGEDRWGSSTANKEAVQ